MSCTSGRLPVGGDQEGEAASAPPSSYSRFLIPHVLTQHLPSFSWLHPGCPHFTSVGRIPSCPFNPLPYPWPPQTHQSLSIRKQSARAPFSTW